MQPPAQVGLLLVLLLAACASVPPATQGEQPQDGAPLGSVVAKVPADGTAIPSTAGATGKSATSAATSGAKTPAGIPASPTSQVSKKDSSAPELEKQKASPPLDLTSLKARLKETQAIGEFAKIALRNQADDLLSQFRAFHQGKLKTTLVELRRPYDLLVLKVLSLLQDKDPSLAAAVMASREAIWGMLANPEKFARI